MQLTFEGLDDENYVTGAFEACQEVYEDLQGEEEDTTPFLCIPFISRRFQDTFEAMNITSQSEFADIYLAFMVDSTDPSFDNSLYSVLASFGM